MPGHDLIIRSETTGSSPASDESLGAKYMDLTSGILGADRSAELMNLIMRIETLEDISRISLLCSSG